MDYTLLDLERSKLGISIAAADGAKSVKFLIL